MLNVLVERKKHPDAGILLNYDGDDFSHGYALTKETFKVPTRYDILQPYVQDTDFRSSNISADDVGYSLYVFDISYQQNFIASQLNKVEYKIDGLVPGNINGYALVLMNKLVSKSNDGQRHFDLIYVIFIFLIALSYSLIVNFVVFNKTSL